MTMFLLLLVMTVVISGALACPADQQGGKK